MAFNHFRRSLEEYHNAKFLKNHADDSWNLYHIKVISVTRYEQVKNLKNYQLIKYANFIENSEAEEILEHYERDVNNRLKNSSIHEL